MLGSDSHWCIVSGHSDLNDIKDIFFAVTCLKTAGVRNDHIHIFASLNVSQASPDRLRCSDLKNILQHIWYLPGDFPSVISKIKGRNLTVVVAGHGSEYGIATDPVISPEMMASTLLSKRCFKRVLVVFGQCFSGVFNWTNVRRKNKKKAVEACFLGGSGLTVFTAFDLLKLGKQNNRFLTLESLNVLQKLMTQYKFGSWPVNYFLFQFFSWVLKPRDLDGDGKNTALDAFKYVSILSNENASLVAGFRLSHAVDQIVKHRLDSVASNNPWDSVVKISQDQMEKDLADSLMPQDPWILNAHEARRIVF